LKIQKNNPRRVLLVADEATITH